MSDRKCSVCHYKVSDTAKFCPDCGAPLQTGSKRKAAGGSGHGKRDGLILAGVLVAVVSGYFLVKKPASKPQPPTSAGEFAHPEVEGASPEMVSALANLPKDYDGLVQMGHQTMDQGNFAMAAECYRRALAISGSSPDVRTDYGACLSGMGLPQRAIEEFRRVINEHPEHGIANFNMGIVFYNTNQNDSAKFYWEKYLALEPNGSAAESARSLLKQAGG